VLGQLPPGGAGQQGRDRQERQVDAQQRRVRRHGLGAVAAVLGGLVASDLRQ
jgi:hypothetical protein